MFTFGCPPYNEHYVGAYDERGLQWRRIGAADKARNIAQLLGPRTLGPVLEVGCETGAVLAALQTRGIGAAFAGIDLADPDPHRDPAAGSFDLRAYDWVSLPFLYQSFDLVYATHVLEHVSEPRALLAEMLRVTRDLIYLEVPCELHARTSVKELQRSLNIGYINAYTPESFQLLIETSGIEVLEFGVFEHSLDLHRFGSSEVKARLKHAIRKHLLTLNSALATRVFTYHCGALGRAAGPM